ncbi:MAG: hypothetical protein KJ067_21265 [Vicinamibacteria bacterium]|nr:hypothetical protein [Vicinamibacteria bacterium]
MNAARPWALAGLLAVAAPSALAGPWALGPGHVYLKLGYGRLDSDTLANPDGSQVTIPRFVKDDLHAYAAIGVSERVTLSASVPLRRSDLEDFGRESGLGDVAIGVQWQLGRHGGWVLATRGVVQAPTGDETRAAGILPTGSGVWEGELRLAAGRSLGGGRGYFFAEAGHQFRELLRDGFVYEAQVGWNAHPRLVLAWNLRGIEPWSARAREVALGSPVGVGDGVGYLAFGPTAIARLGRGVAVQLDLDGAMRERNLAVGSTWRVGVSWSR